MDAFLLFSTSHEISHLESERRLNNKRWPWERQNDDITTSDEDENAQNYSNQEMYKKFRLEKDCMFCRHFNNKYFLQKNNNYKNFGNKYATFITVMQ